MSPSLQRSISKRRERERGGGNDEERKQEWSGDYSATSRYLPPCSSSKATSSMRTVSARRSKENEKADVMEREWQKREDVT